MNEADVRRYAANCRFTDHARREMDEEPLGRIHVEEVLQILERGVINCDHDLSAESKPMGSGFTKEEALMQCVICKRGMVKSGTVQAELRIGIDHLMVPVETEVCDECGEAYYSTEIMRHLKQVRENFLSKVIAPPSVGQGYQTS